MYWFSPVQMTVLVEARTWASASMFSAGTGSSSHIRRSVLDRLGQGDGRGQVELAVAVDGQVDLVADRLAHALDQADDVASSPWRPTVQL